MIDQAQQLATRVGVTRACEVLTVPRSSFYRTPGRSRGTAPGEPRRTAPPRALTPAQRLEVRDVLNSDEFCDHAPECVKEFETLRWMNLVKFSPGFLPVVWVD
jgi:putative transposase